MDIPKLQVALDNDSIESAFDTLKDGLAEAVDIIEVGTYLIMMEGLRAVSILRAAYPNKLMVTDNKIISPHFGTKILEYNTQFVTLNSTAMDACIEKVLGEATQRGQECQIELYGDSWSFDDLEKWKGMGIKYIVYSRPRLRKGSWSQEDAERLRRICDMGYKVTATGGISYDDLDVLAGIPIFAIICGRSIRNAQDPAAEARRVKERMTELWGK